MAGLLKPLAFALTLAVGASAAAVRPAAFTFTGLTNRFVTPNGDGRNDSVTFRFENPRDSGGTLKIYDLRGHKVGEVDIQPTTSVSSSVSWTPSTNMQSGVYIYVIQVESSVVSGAVVVVR